MHVLLNLQMCKTPQGDVVSSSAALRYAVCVLRVCARAGFTKPVAQWVTTNLRPAPGSRQLRWTFDLDGIAEMYDSYEDSSMWELLQQPPQGLSVDFIRAERSSFRWEGPVVDNLQALGHRVHLLRDAGHVVHQDNPSECAGPLAAALLTASLHTGSFSVMLWQRCLLWFLLAYLIECAGCRSEVLAPSVL
jgi:pimeloyl-ACP methyl ester carboxylesterase